MQQKFWILITKAVRSSKLAVPRILTQCSGELKRFTNKQHAGSQFMLPDNQTNINYTHVTEICSGGRLFFVFCKLKPKKQVTL